MSRAQASRSPDVGELDRVLAETDLDHVGLNSRS
jgi:hypothetical protein